MAMTRDDLPVIPEIDTIVSSALLKAEVSLANVLDGRSVTDLTGRTADGLSVEEIVENGKALERAVNKRIGTPGDLIGASLGVDPSVIDWAFDIMKVVDAVKTAVAEKMFRVYDDALNEAMGKGKRRGFDFAKALANGMNPIMAQMLASMPPEIAESILAGCGDPNCEDCQGHAMYMIDPDNDDDQSDVPGENDILGMVEEMFRDIPMTDEPGAS